MNQDIKQKMMFVMEELPAAKLEQILEFMEHLLQDELKEKHKASGLDPQDDPIMDYIGGASHGSLAFGIDKELYGGRG